jgi:hypothetical protein
VARSSVLRVATADVRELHVGPTPSDRFPVRGDGRSVSTQDARLDQQGWTDDADHQSEQEESEIGELGELGEHGYAAF